ncbi:MAG: uracil-DNA glycosylase family protein [Sterolibacterium sp.]|nr:uracil-DNA glycosylase family protein [Sterolibacterium sp.]
MGSHKAEAEKPAGAESVKRYANDLPRLLVDARACQVCAEYLPLGPRPVFQFDPAVRILIASQAPGRKVHETGLPFNDASGERLRSWLGVRREQFYDAQQFAILPMGFCFPGSGRSGDLPPRPECAPLWRQPLLHHLPQLQLTLVIGQYALAWHLPEWRGQTLTDKVRDWHSHWPSLLVLPHPSPRNNLWLKRNPWFEDTLLPHLRARVEDILK